MLDEWTHTFEVPLTATAALGTLDVWVKANIDNQALPSAVWQDLAAIEGRCPRIRPPPDYVPGNEIMYPGVLRSNLVEYASCDITDLLQATGIIALACPTDLETNSAVVRYFLRGYGKDRVFALRGLNASPLLDR